MEMRIRITERLRLEPIGPAHAGDLYRLHQDEAVAAWYGGRWTAQVAEQRAAAYGREWETEGSASGWLTIAAPATWSAGAACPGAAGRGGQA